MLKLYSGMEYMSIQNEQKIEKIKNKKSLQILKSMI